jgi:alkylation response protein AidB-like acyl-CoA dehydrogenase
MSVWSIAPFELEHAATEPEPGEALLLAAARFEEATLARKPQAAEPAFPRALIEAMGQRGLLAPKVGTLWAGLPSDGGADLRVVLAVLSAIGRIDLSLGRLYEGHLNALHLIGRFGTDEQRVRAAADARAGLLFGVWNTDAERGVRLERLGPGRWRLAGGKVFASGVGHVPRPLISAAWPHGGGRQLVLLELGDVADRIERGSWRPMGMEGSASFAVDLDGIEVDAAMLVGAPDDYARQPWFGAGAIRFVAVQLGGAQRILDIARADLVARRRFEDPYQIARVAEMAIVLESGAGWLARAAAVLDDFEPHDEHGVETVVAYAAMARCAIERICLEVMEGAVRSVGMSGLLRPHPLERSVRDLTLYLRQPGPDAALAAVGRHVLAADRPVGQLWSKCAGDG